MASINQDQDSDVEFARLLHESQRELFGFIFTMLQNRADAEDVYQQCAVVLWKKLAAFTPGTSFTAWAIQIAQYKIKDFVKSRRRQKVFFSDGMLDAIAVSYQARAFESENQRMEALASCLEKLSDRDRSLLTQCYAVNRDYRKIAQSEGKTIAAVYQAISRIRRSLYNCIQRSMAAEQ